MTRSVGALFLTSAVAASLATTVADARTLVSSPLDGRWTFTWTPAETKSPRLAARYVVEFRDGHLTRLLPHPVLRGARFSTSGNVATLVFPPGTGGVVPGRPYTMRWSIYRDRLTWAPAPGRAGLDVFYVVPWTRVH